MKPAITATISSMLNDNLSYEATFSVCPETGEILNVFPSYYKDHEHGTTHAVPSDFDEYAHIAANESEWQIVRENEWTEADNYAELYAEQHFF